MQKTGIQRSKYNPWGEENPEKIRQSEGGTNQYNKSSGLLNPMGMLDQLFGSTPRISENGNPSSQKEKSRKTVNEKILFSYRRSETTSYIEASTNHEIGQIVQKLKEQVTLLEKSEKGLSHDIAKIKVEQLPKRQGIYYLRFFEWLINLIKQLRSKVEEGRTWLQATTGKKKKMGYWKMYKKHGTTFGLSNERTMATQSG